VRSTRDGEHLSAPGWGIVVMLMMVLAVVMLTVLAT
jgi:hypothetical protein